MADQTLKTIHPWLQENDTKVSSGGTVKSYSHDLGSGPVLCVVHGWPQSAYMWRHVIASWKDSISLFIVELPGYGFSSLPPAHDKRTVGTLILEALQQVFPSRPVVWCGHDRGARIGHRMIVDNDPKHNITSAILIDIVPTKEQWAAFANPLASVAYYHWPFLAIPTAPQLIEGFNSGPGEFTRINLSRAQGANSAGVAKFREDLAIDHYAHQFTNPECVAGSCGDYAAGATTDVEAQEKDQREGRKVSVPLMVVYSAGSLGRMHNVEKVWGGWVDGKAGKEVRFEGIGDEFGHYLPEECPEKIVGLVGEWIGKYGK
ncbi:hypothetical protein M409DRAFT_70047 [Zasmidium cellare ATCC 36951]|uniref:AB hydrolase-1 domain-containing protein n=1 Tax=Zasmidium cellare ATCC 36951 TaxID=1080233 RepID=A0A6A6C237_ZASCE|nr:uncharacterized protein M409DRAFT_70047 [Zasmidium cellare ATCC 36951]KAF2160963.1 hypothetical protein M409DRAFT_70047 [Zasmidium cellare ATCC 36951]